ncbi:MAG: dienelactone hydrolase family protein [Gemmataceae bacterium]
MPTLLLAALLAAEPVDWPALVQKPHAGVEIKNVGLLPLLVDDQGNQIGTRAGWAARRAQLESAWLERLGKNPAKPDKLDVKIDKTEKFEGYTRQQLSFAAEGNDRINAFLLIPDSLKEGEKRPAVVVFHETTRDTYKMPVGLGSKPELALALQLTRRGYVTLSPECFIIKDPKGWALGQAKALAERRPGWTGMAKMTFDASRCIDFLETVPQVDKDRIGCIGFSLGAKEVLYAVAFEPRYRVGVFNEGGIGLRMSNWTDPWYLTEEMKKHIPRQEHHQVLALIAPRPFLIQGGDSADGDLSWTFVKAALPVYELLGAGDRLGLHNHKGKHSYPLAGRKLAYRWLVHWMEFEPTGKDPVN